MPVEKIYQERLHREKNLARGDSLRGDKEIKAESVCKGG
jgi:hypothetical protein